MAVKEYVILELRGKTLDLVAVFKWQADAEAYVEWRRESGALIWIDGLEPVPEEAIAAAARMD